MLYKIKDNKKVVLFLTLVFIFGSITGVTAYAVYSRDVLYDNTTSGLQSTEVQGAIDELSGKIDGIECRKGYTKSGSTATGGYICKREIQVGDYISLTPNSSSTTIPGSMTGYTTKQAPYSETSARETSSMMPSMVKCCCQSGKPSLNTTTGEYSISGTVYTGTSTQYKYCARSGASAGSSCSYHGSSIMYPTLVKSTPATFNYTEYSAVGTDTLTNQVINPSELTLWRIISKNNNGSFDAVSEYTSSKSIYFKGVEGYQNLINGLQTAAAGYAKSGYTSGTRMMGFDGQTPTISNTSAFNGSTTTAPSTETTPNPTTGTGQEYSGGVLGDTLYLKDYQLVNNVYGNLKAYRVGTTSTSSYRLASRSFGYNSGTSFYFYNRYVDYNGNISNTTLRYYNGSWGTNYTGLYLRPIITLSPAVNISGGSGTSDNPYTLSN